MSDITDIGVLVRNLVLDFSRTMIPGDIFTYSTSSVFNLTESNSITITGVFVNNVEIGASEYSFDSSSNKLTVTASLSTGDSVEVQYTYYCNYSNAEVEAYIRSAVVYLSVNQYYTFEVDSTDGFYPDITDKEKNIIAFVASILMKPDNISYRLPDMSIMVPKSLPTRDIIGKAIAIFKHNTHGHFDLM